MTDQTPAAPVKLTAKQKREAETAKRAADAETVKAALNGDDAKTPEAQFGLTVLRRAQDIRSRHEALIKERSANRDMLRAMVAQDLLTPAAVAAVAVFYPEPKTDDDPAPAPTPPPATPPAAPKTPPAAPQK